MSDSRSYQPLWDPKADVKLEPEVPTLFKRKGHFDSLRNNLKQQFKTTKECQDLVNKTKLIVRSVIKRHPELLRENPNVLASLIESTIERCISKMANYQRLDPLEFQIKGKTIDMKGLEVEKLYDCFETKVKNETTCAKERRHDITKVLLSLDKQVKNDKRDQSKENDTTASTDTTAKK